MNEVMLSIRPEWLEMIFNEEKGLEFRNKIISTIKPETIVYFYETKNGNGKGKVVGDAVIIEVNKIDTARKSLYYQCFNYIGYCGQDYFIRFTAVRKYNKAIDISEFEYLNGKQLKHPLQNMVNVRRKNEKDM